MATAFKSDGQFFYVSNRRFDTLIDFAITTGRNLVRTEAERTSVARIEHSRDHEWWPGFDVDLGEYFSKLDDRKLWAIVFNEIAWQIFDRRIGNQENATWQVSVITECRMISLFLEMLVWKDERGWKAERRSIDEEGMRPDALRLQGPVY
jgi:hypothetical protein